MSRETFRRIRRALLAVAAAAAVVLAIIVIGTSSSSPTTSTPSAAPNFGAVVGQVGMQLLADQKDIQPTVTPDEQKIFALYAGEWTSPMTGVNMTFDRNGVACFQWGVKLHIVTRTACGKMNLTYQLIVHFTIRNHNSRHLYGTIVWVNKAITTQGSFKLWHIVVLIGNPHHGYIVFSTGVSDPAQMFRK